MFQFIGLYCVSFFIIGTEMKKYVFKNSTNLANFLVLFRIKNKKT